MAGKWWRKDWWARFLPVPSRRRRKDWSSPNGADEIVSNPSNEKRIRLIFNGASTTGTPLIARMAVEKHILANIVSAGTRCVGDRVYGTMLLGIPGGEDEYKEAKAYIESVGNVIVEEV